MRRVIYSEYVEVKSDTRIWNKLEEIGEAVFHQFGCSYLEFDEGPANYTTAIIELPNGEVKMIPVENIKFLDQPTTME